MDLQRSIISKTLEERALVQLVERGIKEEFFPTADHQAAFQWMLEYYREYGDSPTAKAFKLNFPTYKLLRVTEPLRFLIDELRDQRKMALIDDATTQVVEQRSRGAHPEELVDLLASAVRDIHTEVTQLRDIDLTTTWKDRIEQYEALKELPDGMKGIPCGLPAIDDVTSGYQAGQLITLIGEPKSGKAQPLSAPVLTPQGWVGIGTLRVGDSVIGSSGRPTKVVGVKDWARSPVYAVHFDDGVVVHTHQNHEWEICTHNDLVRGDSRIDTTEGIAKTISSGDNRYAYVQTVRVEYREQELPVPPYELGLLLGDGALAQGSVRYTSADDALHEVMGDLAKSLGIEYVRERNYGGRFTGRRRGTANALQISLRELGLLGTKSRTKFIPEAYLRSSVAQRQALLAGLLDTDGGVEGKGVSYCSMSEKLARGVVELVQSLGGVARIRSKLPHGAYVVRLRTRENPFWLLRKKHAYIGKSKNNKGPLRRVVAVERQQRRAFMRCIQVAASDGIYLTSGYVPTHNSTMLLRQAITAHEFGVVPLFIGFEMTNQEQAARADSMRAHVSHSRLIRGKLKAKEEERLVQELRLVERKYPHAFILSQDVFSATTLSGLQAKVQQYQPQILFVDGVYMMDDEEGQEEKGSPRHLTNLTRGLKRLAQQLDIPVIITTQVLTWKLSKRKKMLTADSIGYSSSFAQDSDLILGVEHTDNDDIKLMRVVLSRNTARLAVQVQWDWDHGEFVQFGEPDKLSADGDDDDEEDDDGDSLRQ